MINWLNYMIKYLPVIKVVKGVIVIKVPVITCWLTVTGMGIALLMSACHALTW